MKILKEKYPMGSFKNQKTAGRYIDGYLYDNLQPIAKSVTDDMTFMGIIYSSTLENGTGKSVLAQQIGEAYTTMVNEMNDLDIPFNMNNVVFTPKTLIERAYKLPKYSCIILDEWEDSHYWSELGITLRQFFRKCRQLNLFMICIIPNYFQMPMNYAISRSLFAIDVVFNSTDNKAFDRGYFSFYNFGKKKNLYIKGKKTQNYNCVEPIFRGRFLDGYAVPEKVYRQAKYDDMIKQEKEAKRPNAKQVKMDLFKQLRTAIPEITMKRLAEGFGISERTGFRWLDDKEEVENSELQNDIDNRTSNYNILTGSNDKIISENLDE
jgi:hypothetical protein